MKSVCLKTGFLYDFFLYHVARTFASKTAMTEEREKLLETTIKEMLSANMVSLETRDSLIEKLVRQFVDDKRHKIVEFELFMSDAMKKRFQFELDMEKFTGL